MGSRLFDRTSRHVRLTPIGEQLVAAGGPLHAQLVEAIADARHAAAARTAKLLIGFSRSLPGDLVDAIRAAFEAEFPGSRILPVTVNPLDIAALALDANEPVTHKQLIAATWGDAPPSTVGMLHNVVSRLRRALAAVEPDGGSRMIGPSLALIRADPPFHPESRDGASG